MPIRPASRITHWVDGSGSSLVQLSFTLLLCLINFETEQEERDNRVIMHFGGARRARHRAPKFIASVSHKNNLSR